MGLKSKDGVDMKELWKDGVGTYLGMLINGFPNTFMVYSPQGMHYFPLHHNSHQSHPTKTNLLTFTAPTALSNGPTILEAQVDFIVSAIAQLEEQKAKSIEPTRSAQDNWKKLIAGMSEHTLFPLTSSWWTGGNVPGKKAEPLTYVGGIEMYEKTCRDQLDGWKGFEVVTA
jgi:hypothetical protein